MKQPPSFLAASELELFRQPGRYLPRYIDPDVNNSPDPGTGKYVRQLVPYIVERIRNQIKSGLRWFECLCVVVNKDDGMSWSAEAVNAGISKALPQFNHFHLSKRNSEDRFPLIASMVGKKELLKQAVKYKLTNSFFSLSSWSSWAIIGVGLIFGAVFELMKLVQTSISTNSPSRQIVAHIGNWLIAGAITLLGFIAQKIISKITTDDKSRSIREFLEHLDAQYETDNFEGFVRALAHILCDHIFPRAVIIDNYQRLDLTTRRVIEEYFVCQANQAAGVEYWVVFEDVSGDALSTQALLRSKDYGYARTHLCHQLYLSGNEKQRLVDILGRPERAADFSAVKNVCYESEKSDQRLSDFFTEYRRLHPPSPNKYSVLDFLYLMSLGSGPGEFYVSSSSIIKLFTQENRLRSKVLVEFLKGTKLSPGEFMAYLQEIEKAFPSVIAISTQRGDRCFRVVSEASRTLVNMEGSLNLPSSKIGHIFWALFWYDRLPKDRYYEAFWIRKLVYHLLNCDSGLTEQINLPSELRLQLFEAYLFATEGCIRTCVYDDLGILFDKALQVISAKEVGDAQQLCARLFKQCWKAYSILGDEHILGKIAEIFVILNPAVFNLRPEYSNVHQQFFFESISLPSSVRNRACGGFFYIGNSDRSRRESLLRHAESLSACMIYVCANILNELRVPIISEGISASEKDLWKLTKEIADYIYNSEEKSSGATDAISLSICLLAGSLRLGSGVLDLRTSIQSTSGEDSILAEYLLDSALMDRPLLSYRLGLSDFNNLVDLSMNAVLVADKLANPKRVKQLQTTHSDILFTALGQEIYISVLAAIFIASSHFSASTKKDFDPVLSKNIDDILEYGKNILGHSFSFKVNISTLDSPELLIEINSLLELSIKIWDRLGIKSVAAFARIRQYIFSFKSLDISHNDYSSIDPLLVSLSSALNEVGFVGILANLVVVDSLSSVHEISAHFANMALRLIGKGGFGSKLNSIIASLVLRYYAGFAPNVELTNKGLFAETEGHPFFLELLRAQPEAGIIGLVLSTLNYAYNHDSLSLLDILNSFVDDLGAGNTKSEIRRMIELYELDKKTKVISPSLCEALLTRWADQKDSWLYPWLLEILINKGNVHDIIIDEGRSVLKRNASLDTSNTYLFFCTSLAFLIIDRHDNQELKKTLLRYIQDAIKIWEGRLPIEKTIEVYQLLIMLDKPNVSTYLKKAQDWTATKLYRDYQQLIPEIFETATHFLIFEDYYRCMRVWGLKVDTTPAEMRIFMHYDYEKKEETIRAWKAAGSAVPEPILAQQANTVVSGEFLYLGHFLFSPPLNNESTYEIERSMFNSAAKKRLPSLLETILTLESIPESLARLLAWHADRFKEFPLIDD